MRRRLWFLLAFLALVPVAVWAQATSYTATFDGAPGTPQPVRPFTDFALAVHTQDDWDGPPAGLLGSHGANCAGPPATHPVTTYLDSVFQCSNHVMTTIEAAQYGVIYLLPPALVDFSAGPATVRFDVSTQRTSERDWIDLWVSPYGEHLELPLEPFLPDLNGYPRRAVQLRMDNTSAGTSAAGLGSMFRTVVVRDFTGTEVSTNAYPALENVLTPSAAIRTTFELTISRTHLKFGLPAYDLWWMDGPIADLGWDVGVVQFGHHSYNPLKDCQPPPALCAPNTWHWDTVSIAPSQPLTILPTTPERVSDVLGGTWLLDSPAPADAFLMFTGRGNSYEVSYNGGTTWQAATAQPSGVPDPYRFQTYWQPIPAGTTQVQVRAQGGWWGTNWQARDAFVLAKPGPPRTATPTAVLSPTPTRTATPLPSPTVGPTSTPPPSPTPLPPPTLTPTPDVPQPTPTLTTTCALVALINGQWTLTPQAPASCPQG